MIKMAFGSWLKRLQREKENNPKKFVIEPKPYYKIIPITDADLSRAGQPVPPEMRDKLSKQVSFITKPVNSNIE